MKTLQTITATVLALALTACTTPTPIPEGKREKSERQAIEQTIAHHFTYQGERANIEAQKLLNGMCDDYATHIAQGAHPVEAVFKLYDTYERKNGYDPDTTLSIFKYALDGFCPDFRRFPNLKTVGKL